MTPEVQGNKENLSKEEKFGQEFKEESKSPDFDSKTFKEMTYGVEYDENLSKEENLKNAFENKFGDLVNRNLKNIPDDLRLDLEIAKQKVLEGANDISEILDLFKEVKDLINTRNGASGKGKQDMERKKGQEQTKEKSKELQDFVDKLKELRESQDKKDEEQREACRDARKKGDEEQQKDSCEANSFEFPPSQKEPAGTI